MQLFSKDENGNRYIGIQGQISTNWGQSTNSLTSHQSNMIASQISDERLYHHDITYNYKNMNGAMSDNFSYTADSSGVALYGDSWVGGNGKISMYGDGDKIIITKHMKPSLNVNAAVWSNYAYEAFTYTNVGSVYDSVQQYNNGTMSGYELAGYGAIGAMFGGVGVKGAKYIDKVSDVIHVTPKVLLFHQIIKYQINIFKVLIVQVVMEKLLMVNIERG